MKRKVGWSLLLLGIIVFFAANIFNSGKEVAREVYRNAGHYERTVETQAGLGYEVRIWVIGEETGLQQWAEAEAVLTIVDAQGVTLFSKGVRADRASSQQTGGVTRAQNGTSHRWAPVNEGPVTIAIDLLAGDKVELEVFEDLNQLASILPGLSILLAFSGLVTVLRSRARKNGAA